MDHEEFHNRRGDRHPWLVTPMPGGRTFGVEVYEDPEDLQGETRIFELNAGGLREAQRWLAENGIRVRLKGDVERN